MNTDREWTLYLCRKCGAGETYVNSTGSCEPGDTFWNGKFKEYLCCGAPLVPVTVSAAAARWRARAKEAEAKLEEREATIDEALDFAVSSPEKIARLLSEPVREAVIAQGRSDLPRDQEDN